MEAIFESLLEENEKNLPGKEEMIAIKILELLTLCDRYFSVGEVTTNEVIYDPLMEQFTELIEQNFMELRSVQFYALLLNLYASYLNFKTKRLQVYLPNKQPADDGG